MNKVSCRVFVCGKFLAGIAALFAVGTAVAADYHWTGAAGDHRWSTAANWDPQQVPAATDVAKFTKAATVTPPADFTGVLWVSEAAVTVNAGVDAEFSLKLGATSDTKSSLTKTGAGTLTLHPYRGMNFGTITVSAGEVDFAGNGEEAPGAFDKLVVAANAKVRVVDSPIATRHGAVIHGGYTDSKNIPEGYTTHEWYYWFSSRLTSMELYDNFYDNYFACTPGETVSTVVVPTGSNAIVYENQCIPAYLHEKQVPTMQMTRAIVLSESASNLRHYVKNGTGDGAMSTLFIDGNRATSVSFSGSSQHDQTVAVGWHEFAFALFSSSSYGWKENWQRIYRDPIADGDNGHFTADVLWLGVCFNTIDVAAGGSVAIADGQALAVARGDSLNLAGSLTSESANAVFAVMGSYPSLTQLNGGPAALTALDGFAGTLEVGRTAIVRIPASAAAATYKITGKGVVWAETGTEGRFDASFSGTCNVPAGETLTLTDAMTWKIGGQGTVKLAPATTTAQLAGFHGELRLSPTNGACKFKDMFGRENVGTVALEGGETYTITRADALNSYANEVTMPPLADTSAWKYVGTSTVACIVAPDKTAIEIDRSKRPYLEDGKLILTDACDKSRRGVFLTGLPLSKDDDWSCEFDVHAYIPVPALYAGKHGWKYEPRAGIFCVFLCNGAPGEKYETIHNYLAWEGTTGFYDSYYDNSGTRGTFNEIRNAYLMSSGTAASTTPIDLTKPYHVKVFGCNGSVTEVVSQGEKTFSRTVDASDSFAAGTATLGLVASSDYWNDGNDSLPWNRIEVSNFSGIRRAKVVPMTLSGDDPPDSRMSLSPENWEVAGTAKFAETNLVLSEGEKETFGHAVCKTPIAPNQAFEIEYDVTYTESASPSTATVQAFFLQTEGTNPVMAHDGNGIGAVQLKNTMDYGFMTQTFHNYATFFSGKGTTSVDYDRHADWTLTISANKANHVRIVSDGVGTVRFIYASNGTTDESTMSFMGLANETRDLYLMFAVATTWGPCGTITVSNFSYSPRTAVVKHAPLKAKLTVEDGGAATLKLPDLAQDGLVPTLANVALAGGTALSIEPLNQQAAAKIAVTTTSGDGNEATLTAASGADLAFSSFAFAGAEPCLLKLAGAGSVAFDDPLAFTIPAAWKAIRSAKLVDYAAIAREGDVPAERPLADETGAAFRHASVIAGETFFNYMKDGLMLLLR